MSKIELDIPVESLPDLLTRAVQSVPQATLIEVFPTDARVGRRSTFAFGAETTHFTFRGLPDNRSEIVARTRNVNALNDVMAKALGGAFGMSQQNEVVGEIGRAVLRACTRLARDG